MQEVRDERHRQTSAATCRIGGFHGKYEPQLDIWMSQNPDLISVLSTNQKVGSLTLLTQGLAGLDLSRSSANCPAVTTTVGGVACLSREEVTSDVKETRMKAD